MNENRSWEQLAKYFAGELHGEELKKMESWISSDPERESRITQLYEIWKESEHPPYPLDVEEAWNNLSHGMDEMDSVRNTGSVSSGDSKVKSLTAWQQAGASRRKTAGSARRYIIAAATILIIVSAMLFTYYTGLSDTEGLLAEAERHVLVTQQGERASYQLSDGSRVVLHAGSRLEIPDDYNAENRELYLEGEAYFETAHDSEKPFIVHSKETYTRVVGTRFIVQSWSGQDDEVEVIVSEGKVLFGDITTLESDEKIEALLSQNQRGVLSADKGLQVTDVDDINWYLGWTEGRLIFENRPLSEVLPRLERWYDLEISVEEEHLKGKKITADIDYSLPMSDVLKGLAMSLDMEFEQEGRNVLFQSVGIR